MHGKIQPLLLPKLCARKLYKNINRIVKKGKRGSEKKEDAFRSPPKNDIISKLKYPSSFERKKNIISIIRAIIQSFEVNFVSYIHFWKIKPKICRIGGWRKNKGNWNVEKVNTTRGIS